MHQDTKSARLIAVCKRSFSWLLSWKYIIQQLLNFAYRTVLFYERIRISPEVVTKYTQKTFPSHSIFLFGPSSAIRQQLLSGSFLSLRGKTLGTRLKVPLFYREVRIRIRIRVTISVRATISVGVIVRVRIS